MTEDFESLLEKFQLYSEREGYMRGSETEHRAQVKAEIVKAVNELQHERDDFAAGLEAQDRKLDALAPHGSCACSVDFPDDICGHHSPQVAKLEAERDALRSEVERLKKDLFSACAECGSDDPDLSANCPLKQAQEERDALREQLGARDEEIRLSDRLNEIAKAELHAQSEELRGVREALWRCQKELAEQQPFEPYDTRREES